MVPLIRAGVMLPLMRSLLANGRPVEAMLRRAGLGYLWLEDPFAVVPIRALEGFLIEVSAAEGPDYGARCISHESFGDLAAMGTTLLAGRTPRDSMGRVILAMPYHCSHEIISLVRGAEHTEVRDYWNLQLHPEARHMIEQVVAAILQVLLSLARPDAPPMKRIEMTPHPVLGLEHLRPWFGAELVPSRRPYLAVTIANEVLDTRYRKAVGGKLPPPEQEDRTRLTDLSMSGSIRLMLLARLREGLPSIGQMAAISGMSVRSLQRSLALEGLSYSDLVEQVRRELAAAAVVRQGVTMGEVAANLGYSKQSSFTRAFRRWEGVPPMAHRSAKTGDEG